MKPADHADPMAQEMRRHRRELPVLLIAVPGIFAAYPLLLAIAAMALGGQAQ